MTFGLEKIGWTKKHIAFAILVALGALFLFDITSGIVAPLINFNLESVPFIKVRNIIGFSFFILAGVIYLNQIDYRNINLIGWNLTYWLFLITVILSGLWLFEPSNSMVAFIVNYRLDFFEIISVKNALALVLFILSYKIFKVVKP